MRRPPLKTLRFLFLALLAPNSCFSFFFPRYGVRCAVRALRTKRKFRDWFLFFLINVVEKAPESTLLFSLHSEDIIKNRPKTKIKLTSERIVVTRMDILTVTTLTLALFKLNTSLIPGRKQTSGVRQTLKQWMRIMMVWNTIKE